jgi:flagellar FliL protein
MADEAKKEEKKGKKGLNLKVIFIGLPLFIVQLVLVYFITATFLVKSSSDAHSKNGSNDSEHVEGNTEEEESDTSNQESQKIFNIEDLIINPAGTNGQRLLLLSLGLGVSTEENLNILKENEVVIKDMVINTIAQKTLASLSNVNQKDSLKIELAEKINQTYTKAKVKNIYFSKYLIN